MTVQILLSIVRFMYLCMNAYVHTELQRRMFQPKQAQRTWRKKGMQDSAANRRAPRNVAAPY